VDVALVKQGRLNAEGERAHAHVRRRRRDRFLHHVAQVAGHRHPALARHHGGFDGEQLAADVGPGEPGCQKATSRQGLLVSRFDYDEAQLPRN
jgi:hypothetical protein